MTAPAVAPHVIVVTRCADCSIIEDFRCDREDQDHHWDFTVECPGPQDGYCQAYSECDDTGCPLYFLAAGKDRDDWLDEHNPARDEVVLHGVRHFPMESWTVKTGECWVQVCEGTADEVADLGITKPGRYPVHHEGGWEELRLTAVDEEQAA